VDDSNVPVSKFIHFKRWKILIKLLTFFIQRLLTFLFLPRFSTVF